MAVEEIRRCDACQSRSTKRNPVLHVEFKRSDGKRTIGDLCVTCLRGLETSYGLSTVDKRLHHTFKVVNVEDIPGHQ